MFNSKKVLVTGSGGQLGRTLQKNCSDKNSFEWIFLPKEKVPGGIVDPVFADVKAKVFPVISSTSIFSVMLCFKTYGHVSL